MKFHFKYIALIITLCVFYGSASAHVGTEKFATVFGAKIRYIEAGDTSKPKVILLHGLGGSADSSWGTNIGALAANYHVIAPDQIGFGRSDKPNINYRVGTYVDFLDKMMTELKIEKATIVGNSMGGWVATLLAIRYPSRVEKLILVDTSGYRPPQNFDYSSLQKLNPSTRAGTKRMIKDLFFNQAIFGSDAMVDQFMTLRIAANDANTIQTLIRTIELGEDYIDEKVGEVKAPSLIIWGKQDGTAPVSDAERLNKDIKESKLIVFDQCGHFPQLEKSAEFNKAVIDFIGNK